MRRGGGLAPVAREVGCGQEDTECASGAYSYEDFLVVGFMVFALCTFRRSLGNRSAFHPRF